MPREQPGGATPGARRPAKAVPERLRPALDENCAAWTATARSSCCARGRAKHPRSGVDVRFVGPGLVGLPGMDPVAGEPARDRSASESRASESNSVDATWRQTERISDATPPGLNTESRSDSALLQFCAMVGNLGRYMWHQATDSSSRNWPPKWLKALVALWVLWLGLLIVWLVVAIIIPALVKILVALGLGAIALISETQWVQVVIGPVHSYLDTHSAGLPFSPEQRHRGRGSVT